MTKRFLEKGLNLDVRDFLLAERWSSREVRVSLVHDCSPPFVVCVDLWDYSMNIRCDLYLDCSRFETFVYFNHARSTMCKITEVLVVASYCLRGCLWKTWYENHFLAASSQHQIVTTYCKVMTKWIIAILDESCSAHLILENNARTRLIQDLESAIWGVDANSILRTLCCTRWCSVFSMVFVWHCGCCISIWMWCCNSPFLVGFPMFATRSRAIHFYCPQKKNVIDFVKKGFTTETHFGSLHISFRVCTNC